MFHCCGNINKFELSVSPLDHTVNVSFTADLFILTRTLYTSGFTYFALALQPFHLNI